MPFDTRQAHRQVDGIYVMNNKDKRGTGSVRVTRLIKNGRRKSDVRYYIPQTIDLPYTTRKEADSLLPWTRLGLDYWQLTWNMWTTWRLFNIIVIIYNNNNNL